MTMDVSTREREYSPSSCIGGDYAPFLRTYAERSAEALAHYGQRAWRDLNYGDTPQQKLDLFLPSLAPDAAPPPLLVFIHGGYWQELHKDSALFAAPGCLRASAAFAALDYTLAPLAGVADMALECRRALRWLHAHASDFGYDARRIVVAGSSAGAHLAAMCGLRGWTEEVDLPAGVPAATVLVSGIYDLAPLVGTSINDALGLQATTCQRISPLRQNLAGFPPTVICWGEIETTEFKRQSQDFAAALHDAGVMRCGVFEVPARHHFDVILDLAETHTALGDATLAQLASAGRIADRS